METVEIIEKPLHFDVPEKLKNNVKAKLGKEGTKLKHVGTELFKYWLKNGLPE